MIFHPPPHGTESPSLSPLLQLALMLEAQHALLQFWSRNGIPSRVIEELALIIVTEHMQWQQDDFRLTEMVELVLRPPPETKQEIADAKNRKAGDSLTPALENLAGPDWDKQTFKNEWDLKASTVQDYFALFTRDERRGDSAPGTPNSTSSEEESSSEVPARSLLSIYCISSSMCRGRRKRKMLLRRRRSRRTQRRRLGWHRGGISRAVWKREAL